MEPELSADITLPNWLPDAVRLYLDHTGEGLSLRKLAQREGVAASTVMRQVRRYEARRDDPLVDEALAALTRHAEKGPIAAVTGKEAPDMTAPLRIDPGHLDEAGIAREGRRVLRRLAEPGAVLAVAPEMEKAAVLRKTTDGRMVQTAVLERAVAQAFALKEWITIRKQQGRLSTYELSSAGRQALRRLVEAEDRRRHGHHGDMGMAEAQTRFQPAAETEAALSEADERLRRARVMLAESPVAVLARRRDKEGRVFLDHALVQAAERLREDFELSQLAPRHAWDWDAVVREAERAGHSVVDLLGCPVAGDLGKPGLARERVIAALRDLGPDLADVALRVCCQLSGIEGAERRMGWAARSGKIVLRIALLRLRMHYDQTYGRSGPLIG